MYIFRLPKNARDTVWTYEALARDMRELTARQALDRWGTRLHIRTHEPSRSIEVVLYETVIAEIYEDGRTVIPTHVNDHISHATREWLTLITGKYVYSENFRYNVAGQAFDTTG